MGEDLITFAVAFVGSFLGGFVAIWLYKRKTWPDHDGP